MAAETEQEQQENPRRSQTKTKNLRKAGTRSGFPKGRTNHLMIQYKLLSPENIFISSIIWSEQLIFLYLVLLNYRKGDPRITKYQREIHERNWKNGQGKNEITVL